MIVLALVRFAEIDARTFDVLLKHFSSLDELLNAEPDELSENENLPPEITEKLISAKNKLKSAEKFYKELSSRDIKIVTRFDADYPELLFELNDPPALLYLRGELPQNGKKTIALVGAGDATNEGIALTSKLSRAFSKAGVRTLIQFADL